MNKKVILTGSFGVGKTSLFNRFIYNQFNEKYLTTIGVKVNKKTVSVHEKEVALMLWDIAGEVTQDKVPASYFLGTSGIIYVIDLSRPSTFANIEADLNYLRQIQPKAVIYLVGNKRDLISSEIALSEILRQLPVAINVITSAKEGTNVEHLFDELAREMYPLSK
jgi:small GTP-binding protein